MKNQKRNCKICNKEINVEVRKGNHRRCTSEEGVFFNYTNKNDIGCWFCNECWEEIRK